MRKRFKGMGLTMAALLLLGGCMQTPDTEYIANKEGQATLIEDHAQEAPEVSIAEQVHAPGHVTQKLETDNAYTFLEIDADVVVPDTNAVPIIQLAPKGIESEDVKAYAEVLFDEEPMQAVDLNGYTEEDCYRGLEYLQIIKEQIASGELQVTEKGSEDQWDEDGNYISISEEHLEDINASITELQGYLTEIEEAEKSSAGDLENYEFTQKESKYGFGENAQKYRYLACSLKGTYQGNKYYLDITKDTLNQEIRFTPDSEVMTAYGYAAEKLDMSFSYRDGVIEKNKCQYSVEEAEQMCKETLNELGLEGLELDVVKDVYLAGRDSGNKIHEIGYKGYALYFTRGSQGIGDMAEIGSYDQWLMGRGSLETYAYYEQNFQEDSADDDYMKRMQEQAKFVVTDDGIMKMTVISPMQEQEQLAESVLLLDFEQVLKQAQTQLAILYGEKGTSGNYCNITIGQIQFRYARMQSPNQKDEYILVPVWDFRSGKQGTTYVTINAIDGSVFERKEGY